MITHGFTTRHLKFMDSPHGNSKVMKNTHKTFLMGLCLSIMSFKAFCLPAETLCYIGGLHPIQVRQCIYKKFIGKLIHATS